MLTDYNYVYEDKKYEAVVKNLKATFFDVILREEAVLNNLESKIADEADESVRRQLSELWGKQNDNLVDTLAQVQALAASMRKLDSFVKELSMIDDKLVAQIMREVDNVAPKENTEIKEKVAEVNTEEESKVEEVSQPIIDEGDIDIDFDPNFNIDPNTDDNAFEPITENEEGTSAIEEPVEEPVLTEPSLNSDTSVNDIEVPTEEPQAENVADVPQQENENEEEIELPQVETDNIVSIPEETAENIVSDEAVTDAKNVEPLVPNFGNNTEKPSELNNIDSKKEDVAKEKHKVSVEKLLRESNDKVRAIIVSNAQYTKLANSFDTQEALMYARGVFSDEIIEASNASLSVYRSDEQENVSEPMSTTIQLPGENQPQLVVNHGSDEMELVLPTQTSINVVSNQTQNTHTIEQMLEQANELYKSGRTQDAQVMYDEISKMNQSIQNNNVKAA